MGIPVTVDLLKVYLGTWYHYHCPNTTRTTYDTKQNCQDHDPKLDEMVDYWDTIAMPYDKSSYNFKAWLRTLSWSPCWYRPNRVEDIWKLSKLFPNFGGCVRIHRLKNERALDKLPALVRCVDVERCYDVRDSWFPRLTNLSSFDMTHGSDYISDFAFRYLSNLTSLSMSKCEQSLITDSAFQHLSNLKWLDMSVCRQSTITGCGFQHLSNLTRLDMCEVEYVTDSAFQHLSNLRWLNMGECIHITDSAFQHLSNLTSLMMPGCRRLDPSFEHLPISTWPIDCSTITDSAFQHLSTLRELDMSRCEQSSITDSAFQHLSDLRFLNMSQCNQSTITDSAFQHLSKLTSLKMSGCNQSTITDSAFQHLTNLKSLNMDFCNQSTITDSVLQHLSNLSTFSRKGGGGPACQNFNEATQSHRVVSVRARYAFHVD